jgi:purine-binding chemotaxis protein CheW
MPGYALPILFFEVAGRAWGTELKWIREIVTARKLTPMPNSTEFVAGLVNIRGEVISVIDTASLLKGAGSDKNWKRIIMLDTPGAPAGLAVKGVSAVQAVMPEIFQEPSSVDSTQNQEQYISGITVWNNQKIPLLDIPTLISHLQKNIPHLKEARA